MARPGINNLPWPAPAFRRRVSHAGFETNQQARQEDDLRGRRLTSERVTSSSLIPEPAALDLARRLQDLRGRPAPTLASKQHMRDVRMRISGSLLEFIERESIRPKKAFTILCSSWQVKPEDLLEVSGKRLIQSFRTDLNRQGPNLRRGALFAAIDLEFEPHRKIFTLHLHGVVFGTLTHAINGLRKKKKYRPIRTEIDGLVPVYRPIVVQRLGISPERQLTYTIKSHWKSRWRGALTEAGKFKTAAKSQRISEPYHSLALLWFDRHTLQDITLLMGMEAGSFGLSRTRRWHGALPARAP